jgi:hypothetical protein
VRAVFLDGQPRLDAGPGGKSPTVNTLAVLPGRAEPKEYILLSAHLDSWEGGSGATDNAVGTAIVMEAMRILRAVHPRPRRTILAGHWSGEEQGLNGARGWAAANRSVVDAIHVGFNVDMLVGRPSAFHMQGLTKASAYVSRWMSAMPEELTENIPFMNPSLPTRGGHDAAAFICSGAPVFHFVSRNWDPGYAQHTTVDTFDKIIPEELRRNAVFFAMLAYLADQDTERMPRDRRAVMPTADGAPMTWPTCASATPAWR